MNFPFAKTETAKPPTTDIQDLMDLAVKAGTERGWFGENGQEEAFQERARAELVLREQNLRGELGLSGATLEQTLKELLLRDHSLAEAIDEQGSSTASAAWQWDWRRALGITLSFVLVGIAVIMFGAPQRWPLWLGSGAGAALLILGPWAVSDRMRTTGIWLAVGVRQWRRWLARGRHHRDRVRQIREQEEKITAERSRRAAHEQWVEEHLALLMGQFHLQQRRAEQAVKIAGRENVEQPQEALTYAYAEHNAKNHHD